MKKIITFLLFIAVTLNLFAQFANEQANLEKYWLYRQRLKENFLFLSNNNEYGSNIPVSRIKPNVVETSLGVFSIRHVEYLDWDDCNGALPYYIILLATEYKLLKKYANSYNNNNALAAQTLNELWNAIRAVERLDMFADGSVNGVFMRSDLCEMNRDNAIKPEYIPLVSHFDNLNVNDDLVKIDYREKNWDKLSINYRKPRFNSQDNVLKFIEAEAVVRALLSDDPATNSARSKLYFLCKKMIENMYHPNEPRSFWDRDIIASSDAFMNRTWYLKNPDYNSVPDSLLRAKNGGAGDAKTYATSYGYAKAAKRFGLNYQGTDNSYILFKMLMQIPIGLYSHMDFTKVYYSNCFSKYFLKFVDVSGNHIPITIGVPAFVSCNETGRETKSEGINSDWMVRTLAAINDTRPGIRTTYKYLTDLRENRAKPLEHLPMIWNIVYNNKSQITDSDRTYVGTLLNEAPRCGPLNIQLKDGTCRFDALEWSSPNRFVWSNLNGSDTTWRHGYFNGIDYMVLHNLYWLTKVNASESASVYKDHIIENQQKNITSKSEHVYARYSVKLVSGFKVTGNPTYSFSAGTNPDMRTTYDANMPFTKQNVDFCTECVPIFKDNPLKSASIDTIIQESAIDQTCVTVYPNPANNLITVSSNENIHSITVINSTGKVLYYFAEVNSEKLSFDISMLKQGIYIVKTIMHNGYEQIEKVLKKE